MNTILETQGSLVKVKVTQEKSQDRTGGGIRGKVKAFSKASRKRLLELFARLAPKQFIFITLTYGQAFPDTRCAKRHLKAFIMRLQRLDPDCAGVWRIEYQERGAPHFHLLMTNLKFIDANHVCQMWEEIIGELYINKKRDAFGVRLKTFTRIEKIKGKRKIMAYVSKYVAKKDKPQSGASGFNNVAYQHAGRFWGVINREGLPFAHLDSIEFDGDERVFFQFRRAARKYFKGMRIFKRDCGFTLFSDNVSQWRKYWFRLHSMLASPSKINCMGMVQ